jgi:uncharacterized cupin superfamily protein
MSVLNLFADEWDERRTRPGYTWNRRGLGRRLAGELLGASLYELEPGQATWPYHWHWANEELMLVVAGAPTLRTPEGEHELAVGDVVLFPRGPAGAHEVRNAGAATSRVLIISTMIHPEIGEYPDDGKILVAAGAPPTPGEDAPLELLFDKGAAAGRGASEIATDKNSPASSTSA